MMSFVRRDINFELYTYDDELSVPSGVHLRDAREIYPEKVILRYQGGNGKKNVATFADLFRYKLLYERGGWWVDADIVYTGAEIPEDASYFGLESESMIGNAVLRFESGSPVMEMCRRRAENLGIEVSWGETGPQLVTQALEEESQATKAYPQAYAYPVKWKRAPVFYIPKYRSGIEDVIARVSAPFIHLWSESLRRAGFQKTIAPPNGSYLYELADEVGVSWSYQDACYTSGSAERMAQNYWDALRFSTMQGSRSWKVFSTLRQFLGKDPIL